MSVNMVLSGSRHEVIGLLYRLRRCDDLTFPAEQVSGVDSLAADAEAGVDDGGCAVRLTVHLHDEMEELAERVRAAGRGEDVPPVGRQWEA